MRAILSGGLEKYIIQQLNLIVEIKTLAHTKTKTQINNLDDILTASLTTTISVNLELILFSGMLSLLSKQQVLVRIQLVILPDICYINIINTFLFYHK